MFGRLAVSVTSAKAMQLRLEFVRCRKVNSKYALSLTAGEREINP